MKFRRLSHQCECGCAARCIEEVGLTAEHELVIYWRCTLCQRHVYVVTSLSDLWRECPERHGEETDVRPLRISDAQFLRAMGISVAEDMEP